MYYILSELDVKISKKELHKQFNLIDSDSSKSLEYNEFVKLMKMNFEHGDTKNTIQNALNRPSLLQRVSF